MMNIVFISNFISPHVKPFCDYLYIHTNKEFKFIQTMELSSERRQLSYELSVDEYVINLTGKIDDIENEALKADCAIFTLGSVSYKIIINRIKTNKLTFLMSERLFKRGFLKLFDFKFWKQIYINLISKNKNVYLLCNGFYVSKDFEISGFHKKHSFKFGYFPEIIPNQIKKQELPNKLKLLWVGRMIGWKRPFLAIKIAKLCSQYISTELVLIGDGALMNKIKTKTFSLVSNKLQIIFLGIKSNQTVREYMRTSDFLLMTSNRREGWGAVINEALSEGLPVISEKTVGASRYLIDEGENGFIFSSYHIKNIIYKILQAKKLNKLELMGRNCFKKLSLWNGNLAAERFLNTAKLIYEKNYFEYYDDGPMSKA